jgi:hypothetical protein
VLCPDLDVDRVARGVLDVEVADERPLGALEAELEAALNADRPDARGELGQVGAVCLARLLAEGGRVVLPEVVPAWPSRSSNSARHRSSPSAAERLSPALGAERPDV